MGNWLPDMEHLQRVVQNREPGVTVELKKKFLRHEWYVRVVRDGVRSDYEDVYHYWLERSLVETFCRP